MKCFLLLIINFILVDSKLHPTSSNRRIIGGKEAFVEDFPFVASLIMKFKEPRLVIFSGGVAIIGKYWAITAAHCVYDFNDGVVAFHEGFVRSNTTDWKKDVYKRDHLILHYIIHEKYKTEGEDYDIALMAVKEPFDGIYEKPVKYARRNFEYKDETKATTLGWGTTKTNVEPFTVDELRQVDIDLKEQKQCTKIYDNINISLTSRMVCAVAPGKDACVNDSGGPLVQYGVNGENVTLIGIVSWGIECASDTFPGVYTKVSEFDKWIGYRLHHHHRHPDIPNEYDSDSGENETGIDMFDVYDVK